MSERHLEEMFSPEDRDESAHSLKKLKQLVGEIETKIKSKKGLSGRQGSAVRAAIDELENALGPDTAETLLSPEERGY